MPHLKGEAHPQAKLTSEQVIQIRKLYSQGFSTNVISKRFDVSKRNIKSIVAHETWTHLK